MGVRLTNGSDALLACTLFWFSGHPIVYFWLLPAYISWYIMALQQAGGRLFSDPMGRVSFLLFLILLFRSASIINMPTRRSAKAGSSAMLFSPSQCFSRIC
jgi:cytochrome c/quinol oxidase subunit I